MVMIFTFEVIQSLQSLPQNLFNSLAAKNWNQVSLQFWENWHAAIGHGADPLILQLHMRCDDLLRTPRGQVRHFVLEFRDVKALPAVQLWGPGLLTLGRSLGNLDFSGMAPRKAEQVDKHCPRRKDLFIEKIPQSKVKAKKMPRNHCVSCFHAIVVENYGYPKFPHILL